MTGSQDLDFRAWASARREPLRRTAYMMCGDWYLADDLVQDAMARLYAVWGRVVRTGDPEGYSRRILLNLLIDERRRPWRRREVQRDTLPDPAPVPETDDNLSSVVVEALTAVPPRQRAVLVLRFYEDRSVEETAAVLGCSPGTVKSQTAKGLSNLRSALASAGFEREPLTPLETP